MCGILYVKLLTEQINPNSFHSFFNDALDKMRYRGPDFKGVWVNDKDYLGHVRLSILGFSSKYNQPYGDDEKFKMIFNGEIYNFKEFSKDAESDTEVLFNLLKNVDNPVSLIRGMYAICWYNIILKKTIFYRDFFGEKPLYYYSDDDIFIASSTINSLTSILNDLGKKITINKEFLICDFLLFGFFREPNTFFREIKMLPAGHFLELSDLGEIKIESIKYNLDIKSNDNLSYSQICFKSADVDKYILTSSGIDSTMLLHVASIVTDNMIHTITFKSLEPVFDESEQTIKNVKKILNKTPHIFLQNDNHKETFKSFISALEQPTSDGLNLFNLLELFKKECPDARLIFTGLGGDELFGGYNSFKNWKLINFLIKIPYVSFFIPSLKRFVIGNKILRSWNPYVYYFLYRLDFKLYYELINNPEIIRESFNSFIQGIKPYQKFLPQKTSISLLIKTCELFDYMKNQLLRDNDNISMFFSIESRSPLLDPDKFMCLPDKRKWMKSLLSLKYDINFGKKQGFTYTTNSQYQKTNYVLLEQILESKINFSSKKLDSLSSWLTFNYDRKALSKT